ncbi:hypothetical protein PI124_g2707 [Phytophthora idaei]|nr:hypothetical protein PI125_g17416 [Phytophthora idaei]KAG3252707.1 hypothetical protein PI124_g2707 [Phytophthora idaei]
MLRLCDHSPFISTTREAMSTRAIAESELLAWSATIRRAFVPLSEPNTSLADGEDRLASLLQLVQHQTDQIDVLILQNEQLKQRSTAVEGQICTSGSTTTHAATTSGVSSSAHTHPPPQPVAKAAPALDASSPAYKDEVLALGKKAQKTLSDSSRRTDRQRMQVVQP